MVLVTAILRRMPPDHRPSPRCTRGSTAPEAESRERMLDRGELYTRSASWPRTRVIFRHVLVRPVPLAYRCRDEVSGRARVLGHIRWSQGHDVTGV